MSRTGSRTSPSPSNPAWIAAQRAIGARRSSGEGWRQVAAQCATHEHFCELFETYAELCARAQVSR